MVVRAEARAGAPNRRRGGPRNGIAYAVLVLLCTIALSACSTLSSTDDAASNLPVGDLVTAVPIERGAPANDHPVTITPGTLRRLLNGLVMRRPASDADALLGNGKGSVRPVFVGEDLGEIAIALSGALSRARPDQDVAVRVEQQRKGVLVGVESRPRVTAMRVFYRQGRLNLIFGTLDRDPGQAAGDVSAPPIAAPSRRLNRTARYRSEIGSRTEQGRGPSRLVQSAGLNFAKAERQDWITLGTESPVSAVAPKNPTTRVGAPSVPGQSSGGDVSSLVVRLRALKRLHQQGLIDDTLYKSKVRELVDYYLGPDASVPAPAE